MTVAGKRILVTGADGFIGSHLAEMLCAEGAHVRALCLYNSLGHWGWLDDSPHRSEMELIAGDIRDPELVRTLVTNINVVFHLAALIAIPFSYRAPDSYVQTNVTGTLNLLQASRAARVGRFIQTSTSEVYGTARYVPIDEAHPLQPQSPYSASKIAADALAMSFHSAFGLPLTIGRPFNTFGPRQSARAVIPTIIGQIAAGERTIRLGDLSPTRDFNYVADTCDGLIALAKSDAAIGETVIIGANREISIGDTFALIRELMHSNVEFVSDEQRLRPANSEVFRLWCDNTKIHSLTGWTPAWSLRDGLQATIDWFVQPANLARYKTGIYNL